MSKQETVALCEAKCSECRSILGYPELGDFAYGRFILKGENGDVFAYLDAIDNPAWNYIFSCFNEERSGKEIDMIQELIAKCADKISGQNLTMDFVCPHCQSHDFEYWDGKRTSEQQIPIATFRHFMKQPEVVRKKIIDTHYNSVQQRDAADEKNAADFRRHNLG